MSKKALITGITGQDGSYLAEYLLGIGYEVHGIERRVAMEDQSKRLGRIYHILDKLHLHTGTIDSYGSVFRVVELVRPDECYHLAAQSFISTSFEDGHTTLNTNIIGTFNILSAIMELVRDCRFYFAASSEMFGKATESPQNELTPFHPCSPYGVSKVAGYDLTRHFREAYNMFLVSGILFNHESPRRGMEFVTRKISHGAAMVKLGMLDALHLGNLEAKRDWGHSRDYVQAMHSMLQMDKPDDYVIATGETHSVEEFCECAFGELGLDYKKYTVIDGKFIRPNDTPLLLGDYSKAAKVLGWKPKTRFTELVREMVQEDVRLLKGQDSR